jgi:hypothetical protein
MLCRELKRREGGEGKMRAVAPSARDISIVRQINPHLLFRYNYQQVNSIYTGTNHHLTDTAAERSEPDNKMMESRRNKTGTSFGEMGHKAA